MKVTKLIYETNLITLNEYIDIERGNKYRAAYIKASLTNKIKLLTLEQCRITLDGCHDIHITWYRENKKHDADNVYAGVKFLLDGIVAANVLKGDGRRHVRDIAHFIRPAEKNSIQVLIVPI